MDRTIHGSGTSEADWLGCTTLMQLPRATVQELTPASGRLVVCAPHPDDEILPCGGLLAAAHDQNTPIAVIAISDGERCHGGDSPMVMESMRGKRPAETLEALRRLQIKAEVLRLGLPDGGLAEREDALVSAFELFFEPHDMVITPWALDGHPDHEVTTRAARSAAKSVGCELLETPIWGWHWSRPANDALPWARGVRFELNEEQFHRKRNAIEAFQSQTSSFEGEPPILTPTTLARFHRGWEVYFQ